MNADEPKLAFADGGRFQEFDDACESFYLFWRAYSAALKEKKNGQWRPNWNAAGRRLRAQFFEQRLFLLSVTIDCLSLCGRALACWRRRQIAPATQRIFVTKILWLRSLAIVDFTNFNAAKKLTLTRFAAYA